MTPPIWQDWTTGSRFHIAIATQAREKLSRLPAGDQARLRAVLHELAELAELIPISNGGLWRNGTRTLLQTRVGYTTIRYTVSDSERTISVEDVLPEGEGESGAGFGRIA